MKKFAIACAILMAGLFSSCDDTNFCYEVTITYKYLNKSISEKVYVWTTKNELDAEIDLIEDQYKNIYGEIDIDYIITGDSMDDCESKNI